MSAATADFVINHIRQDPNILLCLPSGDTPTRTLKILVDEARSGKVDFSHAHFVGLDEWVGMDRYNEGSCQHYIYSNFFSPLKIAKEKITFFDAKAEDLVAECKRVDQFIADKGPIDLVVVGVGVNGHIGLNEPGSSFDSLCHTIDLEETTKKGAQKYFSDTKALQDGITLGLAHIMNAKTVVVIANGLTKAYIIHQIIEGTVTESVPGSVLQRHSNCHFFLDQDAASLLKAN